ncbi:hypothetical protein ACFOLJ_20865 [Rugamonas sp. CCM 8940]|uniref:hypothetical protein n=1 Tax=Rugamonas sp. CCM 8940 TaxID=2765359 RepID=UPI0018F45727|nr:hypothetical protein [Rugamonas sp. CCM 8940]MBJ7312226.1 hypothetical protein [Rugamonas sp. CCM 8940]
MIQAINNSSVAAAVIAARRAAPIRMPDRMDEPSEAAYQADLAASELDPAEQARSQSLASDSTANTTRNNTQSDTQSKSQGGIGSEDAATKLALEQFFEGLQQLANRPETQIFQARFGLAAANAKDGVEALTKPDASSEFHEFDSAKAEKVADTNYDGKVSEDELRRYQMPLTYRSGRSDHVALTDSPSAFTLAEANRAYGVVASAVALQ